MTSLSRTGQFEDIIIIIDATKIRSGGCRRKILLAFRKLPPPLCPHTLAAAIKDRTARALFLCGRRRTLATCMAIIVVVVKFKQVLFCSSFPAAGLPRLGRHKSEEASDRMIRDFLMAGGGAAIASRLSEPTIQKILASCMLFPGFACAVAPRTLLETSLCEDRRREEISDTTLLVFRCFGAQACLVGIVLGTCRMTPRSYAAFAAAMIPFVGFNFYYGIVDPVIISPIPMLADFVNNVVMCQLALAGAKLLGGTEDDKKD